MVTRNSCFTILLTFQSLEDYFHMLYDLLVPVIAAVLLETYQKLDFTDVLFGFFFVLQTLWYLILAYTLSLIFFSFR